MFSEGIVSHGRIRVCHVGSMHSAESNACECISYGERYICIRPKALVVITPQVLLHEDRKDKIFYADRGEVIVLSKDKKTFFGVYSKEEFEMEFEIITRKARSLLK